MWLALGFLSALLLGLYDVAKKLSLRDNAVLVVLLLNTLFCSLLFVPLIVGSWTGCISATSIFYVPWHSTGAQPYILLKSVLVLCSWLCGYCGLKQLPLTIVGPINATRPMLALVGALIVFGERLNVMQWMGVITALLSFFLLSRTGKREGITFAHNRALVCVVLAAILGAVSSLYDKYLLASPLAGGLGLDRMEVIAWYNIYQFVWMTLLLAVVTARRGSRAPFTWRWSIVMISLFLVAADLAYFSALASEGALVSLLSMVRRSSVVVSFICGVLLLGERNWKGKAVDLLLVVLAMLFVAIGTA